MARLFLAILLALVSTGPAAARDLFQGVVSVGGGLQYHSLLYSKAVGGFLDRYPAETMRDGDAFVSNDPYKVGNSHVPDMVVVASSTRMPARGPVRSSRASRK